MLTFKNNGIQIFAPLDGVAFIDRELRFMIPSALTMIMYTPEYKNIVRPQLPTTEQILDRWNPWYNSNHPKMLFTDLIWICKKYAPPGYKFLRHLDIAGDAAGYCWGYYKVFTHSQILEEKFNYAQQ